MATEFEAVVLPGGNAAYECWKKVESLWDEVWEVAVNCLNRKMKLKAAGLIVDAIRSRY